MWYTTHYTGIRTVHVSQCKYGTCVCVSRTQATRWMCKQGMELTRINNTYYYVCGVYRTFLVVQKVTDTPPPRCLSCGIRRIFLSAENTGSTVPWLAATPQARPEKHLLLSYLTLLPLAVWQRTCHGNHIIPQLWERRQLLRGKAFVAFPSVRSD